MVDFQEFDDRRGSDDQRRLVVDGQIPSGPLATNSDPGFAGRESVHSSIGNRASREALANNAGEPGDGTDQEPRGTRSPIVGSVSDPEFSTVDHHKVAIHLFDVDRAEQDPSQDGGSDDCFRSESQPSCVVAPELIAEIREQWRRRQAWHRAEKSLTLQAKALFRRLAVEGDKKEADQIYKSALGEGSHPMGAIALAAFFPLTEARDGIEKQRKAVERRLEKLAKQLPVAPWVKSVPGASMMSLAAIVGGAGDLSIYGNPAKLWKRMGLAPYNGKAYATWRRSGGLTADDWTEAGYNPARRSEMWNIGSGLIGGMGLGKRPLVGEDISLREDWSPLEKLFVERLRHEAARDPENMAREVTKAGKESFSKHAVARAKRYVEKRFLRMLW